MKSGTSGGRVSTPRPRVELSRCCAKDVSPFFFLRPRRSVSAGPRKTPSVNKTPFVCEASHTKHIRKHVHKQAEERLTREGRKRHRVASCGGAGGGESINVADVRVTFTAAFLPILWEYFPRISHERAPVSHIQVAVYQDVPVLFHLSKNKSKHRILFMWVGAAAMEEKAF